MTICFGKSCLFGLLSLKFISLSMCASFPFWFKGWGVVLIVLIPDYCFSFYFTIIF